ncbi:MAG: FAD-dependent oxidoreductase [Methanobacteriaceae archaeon]|nr:FAD-dependent oxidoreductase [Methanobacteriaceae archaeon]
MAIIIGSGAGGATVAKELTIANIPVTIIEKGPYIESSDSFKYYDANPKGMDLLKTTCVGGSTSVSMGNAVRSLEKDLKEIGIDLSEEYKILEKELNIHEMDNEHIGKGTQAFLDSAKELGLEAKKMPKFIIDDECQICGKCAFGCPTDAKWTSKKYIDIAKENGAKLLTNTEVTEVIYENNKVKGVKILKSIKENGEERKKEEIIYDDLVILSAGAINSSIILENSNIDAGNSLFMDGFVTMGGALKDINFDREVQMNALIKTEHFVLSPHFSTYITQQIDNPNIENKDILSIMIKIPDEGIGTVKGGIVKKENTIQDIQYIAEGCAVAGAILEKAGVDQNTIISTIYRGAHPGGTAPIGEVVDNNLKTEINGFYICDASVIPKAPGAPPILLIMALAKRLSKHLIKDILS